MGKVETEVAVLQVLLGILLGPIVHTGVRHAVRTVRPQQPRENLAKAKVSLDGFTYANGEILARRQLMENANWSIIRYRIMALMFRLVRKSMYTKSE